MPIKSFKGQLSNGDIDRIYLATNNGRTGYRIVRFEMMAATYTTGDSVGMMKVLKESRATTTTVDFSDTELLAAGILRIGNLVSETATTISIFDREIINQDIFINLKNFDADVAINYYIELEVIPLNSNSAEYTTLKDIRARNTRGQAFP